MCVCVLTIFTTFTIQSFDWSTTDEWNTELLFSYLCVNCAPAARGCCLTCLVQWRYTEMWRSVQRSPLHPQDAENEGIYLQEREKWRKLDCGLHVNAEETEQEAVS